MQTTEDIVQLKQEVMHTQVSPTIFNWVQDPEEKGLDARGRRDWRCHFDDIVELDHVKDIERKWRSEVATHSWNERPLPCYSGLPCPPRSSSWKKVAS